MLNSFSNHFKDKIAIIRCDIDSHATQPTLCSSEAIATSQLSTFQQATTDEITDLVVKSASKSCRLDPIPTCLVKDNISILAPVIVDIVNLSITTGVFPSAFKNSLVSPLLKKTSLDRNELNSYRPVSKLSFVSKIAEKVVAARFSNHLTDNGLYEQMQSAYRPHHSTETALVKVCNDLLCSLDERNEVILVLLDMSAAFDTIDHGTMLSCLRDRFGISGTALKWFESYMENRTQNIQVHDTVSEEHAVAFGVPQGSVLGPLMFISYIAPLCDIARRHGISIHLYADDIQLYISFSPLSNEDTNVAMMRLQACVVAIKNWMIVNKLKLNADKTDAILICSPRVKGTLAWWISTPIDDTAISRYVL